MLNLQKNSKTIYKQIIQNEYDKYVIIGQSIWNQTYHITHGTNYGKIHSHTAGHKITIYFMCFFTLQQEPITKYIDGQTKNI